MTPAAKAFLVGAVGVVVASNPAAAQNYCDEGVGLLIADIQVMLWQLVLGMLVIVALVGLVLQAFPIFTGATAMGNLMIVGVIGFVFILTFIDFAFGAVGRPGIGKAARRSSEGAHECASADRSGVLCSSVSWSR